MGLEIVVKVPNEQPETVKLNNPTMLIGSLKSNHVVIEAQGVDPIHAIIEENDDGSWSVTDLGSNSGVLIDGQNIDVESRIESGNIISIGSCNLEVKKATERTVPPGSATQSYDGMQFEIPGADGAGGDTNDTIATGSSLATTVRAPDSPSQSMSANNNSTNVSSQSALKATKKSTKIPSQVRSRLGPQLFNPKSARPKGNHLEVVAFWDDTVLEVEHFHHSQQGFDEVSIGTPPKAQMIAAGKKIFDKHTLVKLSSSGYSLRLLDGMTARIRKEGNVEKVTGPSKQSLTRRDIAHITYGAVSYFCLFIRPPEVVLGRKKAVDPFFMFVGGTAMILYVLLAIMVFTVDPQLREDEIDQPWGALVDLPKKEEKPKPTPKPKPPEKPKVDLAEKKVEPKPKPPPPKPKPVKPAEPDVKPKPKPIKKPKELAKKPVQNNTVGQVTKTENKEPPKVPSEKPNLNKLQSSGMASTHAKKPDFKVAGPKNDKKLGAAGGVRGAGNNQKGGKRKGKGSADFMGVEGVNNNKSSGVNLSKLGLGVGKVMNKNAPGGINTKFKSAAGGAGGGMGSAKKTYGTGGVGTTSSVGLAGSDTGIQSFGSGAGGFLGGEGGTGGAGGNGIGKFGSGRTGRARANVTVPPGDPMVSGGLTAEEVMNVIRANLNQIRHCYEQLLQRSPKANGKISVNFVIGGSGAVNTANIKQSSISDGKMQGCVVSKIKRWKFPRPRGGESVNVNYPFVFNPL